MHKPVILRPFFTEVQQFKRFCQFMSGDVVKNCLGHDSQLQDMSQCVGDLVQVTAGPSPCLFLKPIMQAVEISDSLKLCVCHGVSEYQLAFATMQSLLCQEAEAQGSPYELFGMSRKKRGV